MRLDEGSILTDCTTQPAAKQCATGRERRIDWWLIGGGPLLIMAIPIAMVLGYYLWHIGWFTWQWLLDAMQ